MLTVVGELSSQRASGVLEVSGSPSGAVYLDDGRIVFARASLVPSLAARLRAVRPELASLGEVLSGRDADEAAIATFAVQGGYLTATALYDLIRSVIIDAFLVLTIPFAMESPVAAIRFTAARTHWTELFPRLGIDLVCGEALGVAERMAEHGLAPTTAVEPCDLPAPVAVLTREQWAVASQIGGRTSALESAARRGAALSDTLECLAGLIRAGLLAPVLSGGPTRLPSRPSGPGRPAGPSPRLGEERLPPPPAAPDYLDRTRRPTWPEHPLGFCQPPTIDVLRQVLEGLKRLS